jgi:hypothetical protein
LPTPIVTLSSAPPSDVPGVGVTYSRQRTTDAHRAFEFKNVPSGTYRLRAAAGRFAPHYPAMSYGAKRPRADIGEGLTLTPRQVLDNLIVELPRGAVISGRISDDAGETLSHAHIVALWFPWPGARGQRFDNGVQSDDLGRYRIFGLMPDD